MSMKIFRITAEVDNLEAAAEFYGDLFAQSGTRHPGARHYFDCGGVILAVLDVAAGGLSPRPIPKSVHIAVDDIAAAHTRAKRLGALAPFSVHGAPASEIIDRPWGERSFYVTDPWGNELCFVQDDTLYT